MNQEESGERALWKEGKLSMKNFRRKFKISRFKEPYWMVVLNQITMLYYLLSLKLSI